MDMDKINKKLTYNQKIFLNSFSQYIDKELYFYGSIKRSDFIPGKSDIDIDIFTDNEISTIQLTCNFLNIKRRDVKKFVYKINSLMVYGYKAKYEDKENGIKVEFSIYNNKYKNVILIDRNNGEYLPLHIMVTLYIIKILFYNLKIISKKTYKRCKRFLMNPGDELKFIEVDN
jgi:hypothetical protein